MTELKELFAQGKYEEVIKGLKEEYCKLFIKMLEFKNIKEEKRDFKSLCGTVEKYYPQYFDTLIHLEAKLFDAEVTSNSLIKSMLNIYDKIDATYKNDAGEYKDQWDF